MARKKDEELELDLAPGDEEREWANSQKNMKCIWAHPDITWKEFLTEVGKVPGNSLVKIDPLYDGNDNPAGANVFFKWE